MIHHTTSLRDQEREELARMMKAYEQSHGKVKTLPIMQRDTTGNFHNIDSASRARGQKRGLDKINGKKHYKPEPIKFGKRGTAQAKRNAVLREEWS